jgi:hypothetical protein
VTLRKVLHNNGPETPVDVDITTTVDLTQAPGCTVTPDPANPTVETLPISIAVTVDEVYTINCTAPSAHTFTFDNEIQPAGGVIDNINHADNTASTQTGTNVLAEADVTIDPGVGQPATGINAGVRCHSGRPCTTSGPTARST